MFIIGFSFGTFTVHYSTELQSSSSRSSPSRDRAVSVSNDSVLSLMSFVDAPTELQLDTETA